MTKILIIDDHEDYLFLLKKFLISLDYEVKTLQRGNRALQAIKEYRPDIVVIDIMMPGITGGIIYKAIRKEISETLPIIISSGTSLKVTSKHDHFLAYCPKPLDEDCFQVTINVLLSRSSGGNSQNSKSGNEKESDNSPHQPDGEEK